MKDLLILDFDGVVLKADELFYQIAKDNFFINRSDRYPISKVRMSEVISTGGEKLFKAVIGRENFTKDDVNIFRKAQVDCFNKENHLFSVLSDIENIYNDYKNGICICSNKPDWIIKEILIKSDMSKFIDGVYGLDGPYKRKPSPDHILHAVKKHSSRVDKVDFVGDSNVDWLAAKNSGCNFIFAEYGYGPKPATLPKGVKTISLFSDLCKN
jgi:phosphoglycolate phosphatase-like HAD superfamily hydrolase